MTTTPTLPTELGQIITDVELHTGVHYSRLVRTGPEHFCLGPNAVDAKWITAFTYNGVGYELSSSPMIPANA